MCYHTKTPNRLEIDAYAVESIFQEYGLAVTVDIRGDYPGYFHADGFTAPQVPIICNDQPDKVVLSEWGYLPGKIDGEKGIKTFRYKFKTLNAKADTFSASRMFKSAFEKRRCVVLVQGFFEYRHETKELKVPYFIHPRRERMWLLAGVYNDTVDTSTGDVFRTVAIATTPANEMMNYIHNSRKRMPFIIDKERVSSWLDSRELSDAEVLQMVRPFHETDMAAYPISRNLNSRKVNSNVPSITEPVDYDGLKTFG